MLCGAFGYGVLVGVYKYWPYEDFTIFYNSLVVFIKSGEFAPTDRVIMPAEDAPRSRFTIYNPEQVSDGYYLLAGWDSEQDQYAIWLYSNKGVKLHSWQLNYSELGVGGDGDRSRVPHGMQALADGSIVVNFDEGGVMARIGVCSAPIWAIDGIFHHSIDSDDNGHAWTWRGEESTNSDQQFLVRFDPLTGEILQEIDFLNEVIKAHTEESFIFSVRSDYKFGEYENNSRRNNDLFHPNDVEVLSASLADRFDGFSAGDLLLSLRNINLVAILDPDSRRIKWWRRGPWMYQHDPDFTNDGKISVFSNNSERIRSEILTIDPATNKVSNNLLHGELNFYTETMGKHSYLPNGNILIVSPGEGRVIEVTANGDKVLEFNNVLTEDYNSIITNGVWLPAGFFTKTPNCSGAD